MTATSNTHHNQPADFLEQLFGVCDNGWVTLFAASPDGQRTTKWAPVEHAAQLAHDAANLDGWNIWFGCATRHQRLDGGRRGGKDDCAQIPGLWVDIDIAGPGHAQDNLPDQDQAFTLVNDFPLQPTVIIHSGHGLQAWWAFQEPHPVAGSDLLARWGATWARRAAEYGHHIDNVFDAPRVMRLPGTINTKPGCQPVPVVIEVEDWRIRYGADDIDQWLDPAPAQPINHDRIPYIGPDRPGDAYNAKHDTAEMLAGLGFVATRRDRDGNQFWNWPAAAGDQGATTYPDGHCSIWSETAASQLGLKTQHGYDPYGLYVDLHHKGDHTAAARQLAQVGYGTPPVQLHELIATPRPTDTAPETNDTTIDQALLDAIAAEYGLVGPEAWRLAEQITSRIAFERVAEFARKTTRDQRLIREADLDTLAAINVDDLLATERPPRQPLFGTLIAQGHNATIVARWKTGKSTFVDNAAIAAATGGMFLGHYQTPSPLRVVIFNYELHDDDMADRLSKYKIATSARRNIEIVNLRGRRLPITTNKGRDAAAELLNGLGAQLWIVDPFGAAYAAAGGQDENNNAEVRSFLIALDEIKRLAGCESLLMPVHTGRRVDQEGDEQGRGATVLEDWPDVRILLTRGQKEQREYRFLRTEGRAVDLEESRLTFDPLTSMLGMPSSDVGVSRSKAKTIQQARIVADAVAQQPRITRNDLFDAVADLGVTNNTDKAKALDWAKTNGLVHHHVGDRNAHHHYIGPVHADADPCPGGWKNQ